MTTRTSRTAKSFWTALRVTLVLTALLGIAYPLLVAGIGQLTFPFQANGSLLRDANGVEAGSALIGQSFTDADGDPLPQYFQSRPSAAGDGYDPRASGGTNLGPESRELADDILARKHAVAEFNDVPLAAVPADAVTSSGSGLDPDISPEYAAIQVVRIAEARRLTAAEVARLVAEHTRGRDAGYLGEARVNVLELNLALDEL